MSIQRPTSVSARLHRVNRSHLDALTDGHPIVRGPNGAMPQASRGEHVDDAARTLEVDLLHAGVLDWPAVAEGGERSLTVLEAAFDESTGRFRSSPAIDGAW